ncbi:2OG-Fe(II) oxygenase [Mitsuaria sp. GD03876]|uniref:prolyl hydroxylase family protein n=1 Tax=Mitsuaria sp. GD03876 TaxID=2975399 RepID=UPI0024482738|nr:2OG-Fe(II) oxygenase [Mitsuaria sp. GD03876]MDH0866759.1 2OG-Fe(II) oxygenase [Mitsuaria sp. GD03876]
MQIHVHNDRVFTVPGFLSPAECAEVTALAEQGGFEAATVRTYLGPKMLTDIRNNERAMVESADWVARLWERLRGLPLPELDGQRAVGLPKDLRFYRYSPGQRFRMHKDGPWREDGRVSRLTFLVYLNDGFAGGGTDFRDFVVQPETGTALLFIHDTWHEGSEVTAGVKYVLRSDVMYAPASEIEADRFGASSDRS